MRAVTAMEYWNILQTGCIRRGNAGLSGAQTLLFTTELYEGPRHSRMRGGTTHFPRTTRRIFPETDFGGLGARLGSILPVQTAHIFSKAVVNERLLRAVTAAWSRALHRGGFADVWDQKR